MGSTCKDQATREADHLLEAKRGRNQDTGAQQFAQALPRDPAVDRQHQQQANLRPLQQVYPPETAAMHRPGTAGTMDQVPEAGLVEMEMEVMTPHHRKRQPHLRLMPQGKSNVKRSQR